MQLSDVQSQLKTLHNLNIWPEVEDLFPDLTEPIRLDWMLPTYSLRAIGTLDLDPLPLVAALACLQISIILVDDILDDDPRGKHHAMGTGRAANLALALQASAHLLSQRLSLPIATINAVTTSLQRMAYQTAVGQETDVQEIVDESAYWDLVQAKSTPFYATAFEVGAVASGASDQTCNAIYKLGVLFGQIIQIMDDLADAFEVPAKPDWIRQNNNLIILYAKTAEHSQQLLFQELLVNIEKPNVLQSAQALLISSGAVSYGVYHIIDRYHEARQLIEQTDLANGDVLVDLLHQQIHPIINFLEKLGLEIPADFRVLR